uniref:NADH-ubiquinone oxidoreductase chain 2 n=1 Tax=Abaria herringbona TaxID=2996732 RepID=A0A9E8LNM8_9NEOP|nr:NADH dehydrogenase subunit 2 [Abaria herringbona]UZZ43701.1 NADH dehydrogenase subunit 2 [Abaria herringbona]
MFMNSSKFIILLMMIFSIFFCLSSNSWFMIWINMEINLFMFLPLINNKNMFTSEMMMKYFIIQTISSLMIFNFLMIMWIYLLNKNFFILIINLCLLMKLGSSPFHFWYIQIIEKMYWFNFFLLSTVQKIIPLIMLNYNLNLMMMLIFSSLNLLMSTFGGMNQTSLRKILGYSSINHLGWMILIININEILWYIYMFCYMFILLNITFMFNYMKINYMNQMYFFNNFYMNMTFFFLIFMSLGGLPPFLGFLPKWMTINFMINNNLILMMSIMIMSSLIILYFYFQPFYSTLMINSLKYKWLINFNKNNIKFYIFNYIYLSLFFFFLNLIMFI